MNFEQISMIGEFVGGIGVLATLLFLLFEVRSNTKILKANAKTSGMESIAHFNETLAHDEILSELFERLTSGESLDNFTRPEQFRLTVAMRSLIQRLEAQYFQYQAGLVDDQYWNTRRTWLKSFLDLPNLSDWWAVESKSAQITDDFVEHINSTKSSFVMGAAGVRSIRGND
ncbi:MAG: hypothetical protein AB8B81_14360 [Halioglobus sp.]